MPVRQNRATYPERPMMTKMLFALSLGFAGLILAVQAGHAAPQCAPREQVLAQLATGYGETRRAIGLAGDNAVIEVFASAETGSWTITATLPDGMTCLVGSGQGFEEVTENLPASGDPA